MEKLQAAIEKARERRQDVSGQAPRTARRAVSPAAARSAWDAIPEIQIAAKVARRNRIYISGNTIEAGYYDRLRTKILQQCKDHGWRRLLVTSPTKSCGKTTTCANLAASFARQSDRHMMLFDMDMRRPELARAIGHRHGPGLADLFEGKTTFEEQAVRLGQTVILSANQRSHPNPSQILLQDRTPAILDELQARYQPDLMVFDTPPMLATDDTMALSKYVDCAVIVVAAETSTTQHVDDCERELAESTNVLGIILNKCKYMDDAQSYYY